MKTLSIAIILTLLFSFRCQQHQNKDFSVLKIEEKTYFGGVAGSGVTTTYRIVLKAKRSFEMTVDSAYSKGKKDQIFIVKDSFNLVERLKIEKGKEIVLSFSTRTASELGGGDYQMIIPGSPEKAAPIGKASDLFFYYKGGKSDYLLSEKIKKLPDVLGN